MGTENKGLAWQIKELFLNCQHIELVCVLKTAHFLKTSIKNIPLTALQDIHIEARDKAYKIIELKRATYYGIGFALRRIVTAILNNEKCILPVSSYQDGEYGCEGYFIGTPTVVGSNGVEKVVRLPLNENDQDRFNNSFNTLKNTILDNLGDIIDLEA